MATTNIIRKTDNKRKVAVYAMEEGHEVAKIWRSGLDQTKFIACIYPLADSKLFDSFDDAIDSLDSRLESLGCKVYWN